MDAMTKSESATLAECEAVIEKGHQTFVKVGEALARIRDDKLYRIDHPTFEAYVQARWGWTDRRARQMIDAAHVVKALPLQNPSISGTSGSGLNERAARELVSVPAADRPGVLDKATQAARGKPVTAKGIKEAKAPMPRPASAGTPFTTRGGGKDAPAADFSADIAEMNAQAAKGNRLKKSGLTEKDQRKAESLFGQLQTVLHRAGMAERLGDHLEAIIRAIKGKNNA